MNKILIGSLMVFCILAATLGFAQSITVQDNASTTSPTSQVRPFADPVLPKSTSLKFSTDVATTAEDITRTTGFSPVLITKFAEIATTAALLEPVVPGVVTFQFNTDNNKLYIRLMEADGTTWGCVATLSDDLTAALN